MAGPAVGCERNAAADGGRMVAEPRAEAGGESGATLVEGAGALVEAPGGPPRGYRIERLPPERLRLEGAAGSFEGLMSTFERAVAESDTARLLALMASEREYREILYPALPAAHPPVNARFETLWALHYPDAVRGLKGLLRDYGGREVRIDAVWFEKPDQDFVNFTLHEKSRADGSVDGRPFRGARLFGSVWRVGDRWKFLSYPDEPARFPS